jgi:hypothetical protein
MKILFVSAFVLFTLLGCAGNLFENIGSEKEPIDKYESVNDRIIYRDLNMKYVEKPSDDVLLNRHQKNANTQASLKNEQLGIATFELSSGEYLRDAMERWVKFAGYNHLIWIAKDSLDQDIRIPIKASASFVCEFKQCLSKIKKAYANAHPNPLFFDVSIKESNKVVQIQLMNTEI